MRVIRPYGKLWKKKKTEKHHPMMFLAGPMVPWREELIELLGDSPMIVIDPTNPNYTSERKKQITWEGRALDWCLYPVFWFPAEGVGMNSMIELGMALNSIRRVILGIEEGWPYREDLVVRLDQIAEDGQALAPKVNYSLFDLAERLKLLAS